ncbi:MAG: hypothetical protein Q8Q09_11245 [Deltaproteobacteria bacterium]|nr:hypothetical protein [Deltaproteobacteria bacterium]
MSNSSSRVVRREVSPSEVHVARYDGDVLVAEGVERRVGDGPPRKHGLWKYWSSTGQTHTPMREEHYEDGALRDDHPNLEAVRALLSDDADVWTQYRAMETAVGSFSSVVFALRRLHREQRGTPSVALAMLLLESCPKCFLSMVGAFIRDLGEPFVSRVALWAESLLSLRVRDQHFGRHAAAVVLVFGTVDPGRLTERWDPLVVAALECLSFPHPFDQLGVEQMGKILSDLPVKRAESLLLRESTFPYYLVSFAWARPTPVILAALLEVMLGWSRSKHDAKPMHATGALQTLRRIGAPLIAPLIALLDGKGSKAAQRDLFLIVLAERPTPEAAAVFVRFLADPLVAARQASRRGIVALGAVAWPALEVARAANKSAGQKAADALLSELRARLRAPAAAAPEGVIALRDLRASIDAAERDAWLRWLSEQEEDGQLERGWTYPVGHLVDRLAQREAHRDVRVLIVCADYFLAACRSGRVFEARWSWWFERCREHWDRSLAIPFLAAELLVLAPRTHFFAKVPVAYVGQPQDPAVGHREMIAAWCRSIGQPLVEPLTWMLTQHEAEEEAALRAWLEEARSLPAT